MGKELKQTLKFGLANQQRSGNVMGILMDLTNQQWPGAF